MVEESELEELKKVLEGELVSASHGSKIDEIDASPDSLSLDGLAVYVDGNVKYNSPPRNLNKKLLEHGYAYMSWIINGKSGDSRALFTYVPVESY